MADNTLATPPLTSVKAVTEYLHPVPLEDIEIGPLYRPQRTPDGKGDTESDITHFARTRTKAVAIDCGAYEELLKAKRLLKKQRGPA